MTPLSTWALVLCLGYAAWEWPRWPRIKARPYDWQRDGWR